MAVVACAVLALVFVLAGCGNTPEARLNAFLEAMRNADKTAAARYCYDKSSYNEISEALLGQLSGAEVKVISARDEGDKAVRERGYKVKDVATVEERMAGPQAEIEGRFKPLIDQANAVLSNAQAEYNNAVEMKKYAAITYGTNMPQYYAEQVRINNALPRVRNAQAKVDQLNAAKAAELAALKAGAEEGYKKDKADADKALSQNSIDLPAYTVKVDLKQGGSVQHRTFTLVEDGVWKVYSLDAPKQP